MLQNLDKIEVEKEKIKMYDQRRGYKKLLSRNLLYTAMTRAKKMLIIIGNRSVVNYMVDNLESKNRKTGLKEKLEKMLYLNENKTKK